MATGNLKGIPPTVHLALKHRAKEHGRSLNEEALACLETAVSPTKVNVDALLIEVRQHRRSLPGQLTDQLLREARDAGRP